MRKGAAEGDVSGHRQEERRAAGPCLRDKQTEVRDASKGKGAHWAGREKQKGEPFTPSWAFQPEESTHTRALFESITSY